MFSPNAISPTNASTPPHRHRRQFRSRLNFPPRARVQPLTTQATHIVKTAIALSLIAFASSGCLNVRTHSTFDPIYMNLDINLKVQLQKELASIFDEIDAASTTVNQDN